MNLITLVYVSSAAGHFNDAESLEVLRVSQRNNAQANVTGMLLSKDGNLMQVLEGEADVVDRLAAKIALDHRHSGMMTLLRKPIAERQFSRWSMSFQNISELPVEDQEAYSPFLQRSFQDDFYRNQPSAAYKLMLNFKSRMR